MPLTTNRMVRNSASRPGDADDDAAEQRVGVDRILVGFRLPQIDLRQLGRRQFGDEGDHRAGVERDAEDVGVGARLPVEREALARRDGGDARRAEIGPEQAGTDQPEMRRDDQPVDLLVGRVGEREDAPSRRSSARRWPRPRCAARCRRGRARSRPGSSRPGCGRSRRRRDRSSATSSRVILIGSIARPGRVDSRHRTSATASASQEAVSRRLCAKNQSFAEAGARIVGDQGVEIVIVPDAVDSQIGSQQSFATKSGFFKHADRSLVVGNTGGLDAVQPERLESVARPPVSAPRA